MKLERLFYESRMISFNYSNKVQNYMSNYTIWLLGNADFVNSQSYNHHVFLEVRRKSKNKRSQFQHKGCKLNHEGYARHKIRQ